MTLHEALAAARARLVAAGIAPEEAAADVELYARTILGWDRAELLVRLREPAPAGLEPRFSEWVARRERHEPSAYIVGVREFWGLEFRVTPAVLIPRPETELVVEEALRLLRGLAGPRVADIGTGSGCIAVALAHEIADCRVVATDVSADALAVAFDNAVRHGVADRIAFVATSYLGGIDGDFDLIAANPPYVRDGDRPALARGVRHEPEVALFGGETGLRNLAATLETAAAKLRPGGWLVVEFGFGQEDDLKALAARHPALRLDHVRADLQGLPRAAVLEHT
ncbi:MAG TPA: peptide chain release factor N(5)-glutamine methyltransferase [Vicinamibacterales bacterium]|nr:peptide chain release factor N(5)-glutamine methyltransferase [Vicinamibacterales bacterium]